MSEQKNRGRRRSWRHKVEMIVCLWASIVGFGVLVVAGNSPAQSPGDGSRRALEAANALDEQAQRASSIVESRAKWLEAARFLDDCVARNPDDEVVASLRFQAAVYLWARSRALLDQVDLLPSANPDRSEVARGLDDAIARFRAIRPNPPKEKEARDSLALNVRFRLAQAIADRARLRPEGDEGRTSAEKEAQTLLDRSIDTPRLQAFARLLHAELSNRLGQFGAAQVEAEEAEKLKPPLAPVAVLDVKINALAGRGQFAEADRLTDQAPAAAERKALWKLRIALAKRNATAVGRDRAATETEAFAVATPLGESGHPDARRGLMELARTIDEPPATGPPEWWGLLAQAQLLSRQPDRAARLAGKGADRARGIQPELAMTLRFKAGACWYQAEKYADADTALTQVVDDPSAARSVRAKAGMLRALSRGKALAAHLPGATRGAYLAALEDQLRDFADEPASSEARWLLGQVRLASNRRAEAVALWSGIAHGQPRWLEAQASAADQVVEQVEEQWINRDLTSIRPVVAAARKLIRSALDQAVEGNEWLRLGTRLARLETIPGVGQPAEAVLIFERILQGPASADEHQQARLGRLVALAEQNRFGEAEAGARTEAKGVAIESILPTVRLLDQLATVTESDLIRKRTGALLRTLLDRWVEPTDRAPAEHRDEVSLRQARALLFAGDLAAAKRAMTRWGGPTTQVNDPSFLRDLGDIYFRLEAYSLAVDAERLRVAKLAAGSPAWFDARYLLALGLYRSDRVADARKIIDATAILHPELGGAEIRSRFERLSQKISSE